MSSTVVSWSLLLLEKYNINVITITRKTQNNNKTQKTPNQNQTKKPKKDPNIKTLTQQNKKTTTER